MSSLNLQDGPVAVSKVDLEAFNKLSQCSIDLYHLWIDESKPASLRRLALRALLRQHVCRDILTIGGYGKKKMQEFYWVLTNRPTLRAEMYEEFLYNLENKIYGESLYDHSAADVLLFLTTVVEEERGKRLWEFFSLEDYPKDYDGMHHLLPLFYGTVYRTPYWVQDSVWQEVEKRLQPELDGILEESLKSDKTVQLNFQNAPQILALCAFMGASYYWLKNNGPDHVVWDLLRRGVELLEQLPSDVLYEHDLSKVVEETAKILSHTKPKLALRYIGRVILYGSIDPKYCDNHDFLLWAYGLICKAGDAEDADRLLLERVNELLDAWSH